MATETGTTKQGLIAIDIFKERDRQFAKWGKQEYCLVEWVAILTEEVGEAAKEAVDYHFNQDHHLPATQEMHIRCMRKELVEVAAVAMQIIEDLDERY